MLPGTTTWVALPNTNDARTEVTGLPALATVRRCSAYQITAKNVPGDWSQPISFLGAVRAPHRPPPVDLHASDVLA